MEGKLKESGGYLGWHEQLLTEKQDLLVTIATFIAHTDVLLCLQLILYNPDLAEKKRFDWLRPLC